MGSNPSTIFYVGGIQNSINEFNLDQRNIIHFQSIDHNFLSNSIPIRDIRV